MENKDSTLEKERKSQSKELTGKPAGPIVKFDSEKAKQWLAEPRVIQIQVIETEEHGALMQRVYAETKFSYKIKPKFKK